MGSSISGVMAEDAESSVDISLPQPKQDEEDIFYCPICLCSNDVTVSDSDCSLEEPRNDEMFPFHLAACGHIMCVDCLSMYCASQVMEGKTDIKCCYPVTDSKQNDGMSDNVSDHQNRVVARTCNVPVDEDDVRRLLSLEGSMNRFVQLGARFGGGRRTTSLLERYERFKFDATHKDTCRRCPRCDHPTIFQMEKVPLTKVASSLSSSSSSSSLQTPMSVRTRWWSSMRRSRSFNRTRRANVASNAKSNNEKDRGTSVDENPRPAVIDAANSKSQIEDLDIDFETTNQSNLKMNRDPAQAAITDNNETRDIKMTDDVEMQLCKPVTDAPQKYKLQPVEPNSVCTKCRQEYCYYHSNAHVGGSCEDYLRRLSSEMARNSEYLEKFTKPCPSCGANVEKIGGCNQMKCAQCGTDFCWLCLAIVDDSTFPTHFQWWNLQGCPNMQLHEGLAPSRFAMLCSKVLSVAQIIFIGVPATVLSLLSCLLCWCFVPSLGSTNRERSIHCISFWGNFLTAMVALPFVLSLCITSGIAWIVSEILLRIRNTCQRIANTNSEQNE